MVAMLMVPPKKERGGVSFWFSFKTKEVGFPFGFV